MRMNISITLCVVIDMFGHFGWTLGPSSRTSNNVRVQDKFKEIIYQISCPAMKDNQVLEEIHCCTIKVDCVPC